MKKQICFLGIGISFIFLLTGCGEKKELTPEKFKQKISSKNYIVEDITNEQNYSYLEKAYSAENQTTSCKIQYYKMKDLDHSLYFFDNNKKILEEEEDDSKKITSKKFANYAKYEMKTSDRYRYIFRVGKTVIYSNNGIDCEKEIKTVVKSLGY